MARLLLFVFLFCFSISSQPSLGFASYSAESIKKYVERTPRKQEDNLYSLVRYLTKPFNNEYDKARAIAFWIAGHISYDEYLYSDGKKTKLRNNYKEQDPKELIRSRVGICGDFSKLFEQMCQMAGIRAGIIRGYAYSKGQTRSVTPTRRNQDSAHAWNYFVYKNKKIYVDTTFMAKGKLSVSGRATKLGHERALKQIKRDNKYNSQTYTFDDYYFDFNYKNEVRDRSYTHQEK